MSQANWANEREVRFLRYCMLAYKDLAEKYPDASTESTEELAFTAAFLQIKADDNAHQTTQPPR